MATLYDDTAGSSSLSIAQPTTGELRIADLVHGHGITDRYDPLLEKLCDTATHERVAADSNSRFCQHVRHAFDADTAYLCNRSSLSIVATSSTDTPADINPDNTPDASSQDTRDIHAALTTMVSDLWNCTAPVCLPAIKVFADEPHFSYVIIPLKDQHNQLLIIINTATDTTLLGDFIADALSIVRRAFRQHEDQTPIADECKALVLDALQRKYQLCSKAMTEKRHEIFTSTVRQTAVEFEGLSLVNKKDKPEPLRTVLAKELYEVANLWGVRYKTTLDCHCLVESAQGYKTLCDNEKLHKFSDGRILLVRVHAETLESYRFIETLRDLIEKAVIHASRLEFDILPASIDHTEALQSLNNRFGIGSGTQATSRRSTDTQVASPASIADEFDLMHINGVRRSGKATQK